MANLGLGIGSFMDGYMKGASFTQGVRNMKRDNELNDLRIAREKRGLEDEAAYRETAERGVMDAQAARQQDISSAVTRGIDTSSGVAAPTFSVGGKTYATEDEALKAAEGQVASVTDYYTNNVVPKLQEHWLKTGQPEKAQAMGQWIQDANVKKGMQLYAQGYRAIVQGNRSEFKRFAQDMYNQPGYIEDGIEVTGIDDYKDAKGNVIGYTIKSRDAEGNEHSEDFTDEEVLAGWQTQLSPEQVLTRGLAELDAARKLRTELAAEEREIAIDDRKSIRDFQLGVQRDDNQSANRMEEQANKAALDAATALSGGDTTKVTNYQARLAGYLRDRSASDPRFSRLTQDEQMQQAVAAISEQDRQAELLQRGSGQPQAQPQGTPWVYQPGR